MAKFGIYNLPQKSGATTILSQTDEDIFYTMKPTQMKMDQREGEMSFGPLDPAVLEAQLTCAFSFPDSQPISIILV